MRLNGKVLLLTGAAGGQGRIAARIFLEAGAHLVLTDRNKSGGNELTDALGPEVMFLPHDIRRREEWDTVIAAGVARFGGIDVLVNNAAIAARDEVRTLTPEGLHGYFDVNVIGALNGMQAVLPAMRARGGGSIVNVCSISALRSTPGLAGYGISKWALRGLSRYAAAEFATDNIRVNLVLPGAVNVSMIKDNETGAGKDSFAKQVPLKRLAGAEEIARTILFLATDAASYVTGAELVVDGGVSA